jgi:TolB protein
MKSLHRPCSRVLIAILMLVTPSVALAQSKPISRPYQLTHSIQMDPAFSPDSKRIVYITVVSGMEQLFVRNVDGSDPKQLTFDKRDHEDPAWSPDGKKIAYVSISGGFQVIHLINIDGTDDEAVTPESIHVIHPRWHPDGLRLAYCTTDDLNPPLKNTSEIQEISLSTRKIKTLISGGINTYPAYSPDGTKIAFRKYVGELNSEVFVAKIDGTEPKNLTNSNAFDGWPTWSPDGMQIAFASNRRSNYQVFLMHADGSNVRLLANTEGRATAPAWSPDGKVIMFPLCKNVDYGVGCEIFSAEIPVPF